MDSDIIEMNYTKNREMTERIAASEERSEYEYAALGYTLHNLYNALEISGVRPALSDSFLQELKSRVDD